MTAWLVTHTAITWSLVGLIWFVQVVHYPLLRSIGPDHFVAYHKKHMELMGWLAGPLMLAEVGTAAGLVLLGERSWLLGLSLGLLAVVWASTVFLQMPLHQSLTQGDAPATIDRLVRTNWWRTIGWTARGLCLALLLSAI